MIKFSKLAAAVALVVAGSAAHAIAVIDDFSVAQSQAQDLVTDGLAVWSAQVAGAVLGGYRDLYVTKTGSLANDGVRGVRADVSGGINGSLAYSQDSLQAGVGHVVWDGIATGGAVATGGLGGLDLLGLGLGIRVVVNSADLNFPLFFNVWTDDANNGIYNLHTASVIVGATAVSTPYDLLFTSFGPADFSRVGAVELVLNDGSKANIDIDIDIIQRIPEPGTLALVGAAILGLGAARRRKNAA